MTTGFEYDVALSFAGEDRKHAEDLANCLRRKNIRVFYDRYEEGALWGKNLYDHLHVIYSQRAMYCVIFISRKYLEKAWTSHERKSAQERALHEKDGEYILPIRIDDTDVPGIFKTIGYQRIDVGTQKLCDLLVEKIHAKRP